MPLGGVPARSPHTASHVPTPGTQQAETPAMTPFSEPLRTISLRVGGVAAELIFGLLPHPRHVDTDPGVPRFVEDD